MARIRTIKPEFFTSEDIVELEPLARILYVALWCEADKEGRLTWKPRTFKMRYLPADDCDIDALCDALVTRGLVILYASGLAFIPSFKSHQHINPREKESDLPAPDDASSRVSDASARVDAPSLTRREEGKGKEGKGREDISTVADATRRADDDFEEFWKAYPKREGANPKDPAAKLFRAAVKAGAEPQEIIEGAKNCAIAEGKNIGTPYIPQAVKWLRDKRWRDYGDQAAKIAEAEEALSKMYYAKADSEQLDAWDKHSMATRSRLMPRDKNFGWYVPSEWPPGYEPRAREATVQPPPIHINSMQ